MFSLYKKEILLVLIGKRGNSVVSALASIAKCTGIDSWLRQGNFRNPITLSFVSFAGMT